MSNRSTKSIIVSLKNKLTKLPTWIKVGIFVVIILGVSVILFTLRPKHKASKTDTVAVQAEVNDLERKATYLSGQGKFNEVIKLWEDYLAHGANDKTISSGAYVQIGYAYQNAQKYHEAKQAFEKAASLSKQPTPSITRGLGLAAEMMGDKTTAIYQYEQTIKLLQADIDTRKPSDPVPIPEQQTVVVLNMKIRELKAAP